MLQKCITKAKIQKGTLKVRFIKILITGSGAAGKTSFRKLLMKNKFINFHHSTNIVQAKYAVSVKQAVVQKQSYDQNVVWLEMGDDAQINFLRQILLSLDSSPLPYVSHRLQRRTGMFQSSVKSENLVCFNKLVQHNSDSTTSDPWGFYSSEILNIITLLDTGGQPEYIHLLPTINVHPMVSFVVHNLSKRLGDQVMVEYSEHGKSVFELNYSNLDMIKFLVSSINDSLERTSSQIPQLVTIPGDNISHLCCVGTHADKVSPDTIHNIDSQLTAMVEKLDSKASIWQNKDHGVLFPVDNTTAGNEAKEDHIANFIRNKIDQLSMYRDIYELPITWMLFELEIRQVCSNNGKAYISFNECYSIAHQTNLISSIEEVRSSLIYHHLLGVLLYYHEIPGLCDYVIIDHQWLFDRISSIVYFSFKHTSNLLATNNLKYQGILTKELIEELDWREELRDEYFINLLNEMKIIAPIKREDGNGEDYFIPCILPTCIQPQCDDILSQYGYLQGEPLLIQVISNLLSRGFFCCLSAQMLQRLSKDLGCQFTQKDTHHTYSNLITFRLWNGYSLSLLDKLSYLEVQIRHQKINYYHHFPIHMKVQDIFTDALETVFEQLSCSHGRYHYGFHCQCGKYDEHIAMLTSLTPPFYYALCRYGSVISTELKNEHTVWLTEVSNMWFLYHTKHVYLTTIYLNEFLLHCIGICTSTY